MIVLPQLVMLFSIAGVGVLLRKRGVMGDPVIKGISDIVTLATNPALLIMITQHEYTTGTLVSFLHVLWMTTAAMAVTMAAVYAACRGQSEKLRPVVALLSAMPNAGFMGLPIIQAVYGDQGTLYLAAVIVAFNLVVWTLGIGLFDRKGVSLRGIINPGLLAAFLGTALFLLRIDLPDILDSSLNTLGSMNTPLAMLILGARLAGFAPKALLNWKTPLVSLVKLIAMPLITLGLARLFNLDPVAAGAMTLAIAMPSAIMSQILAEQYNRDALFAAQEISFTSLLSIVTIPVIAAILLS